MKVDPSTQVSIRFDPVSVEWFLQETVKAGAFSFQATKVSPNFSRLSEAEAALAALLEVYDAAMKACA
jgi:hypothetical protein